MAIFQENRRYQSITYVRGVSEQIQRCLKQNTENICLAFKNYRSMDILYSKMKDPLDIGDKDNVVYCIDCKDCTNRCYIGQTTQKLKRRLGQHISTDRNKESEKSQLARHSLFRNHSFDFDNVKVLARQQDRWKLEFMEELFIKGSTQCVNIRSKEASRISSIYTSILDKAGPWAKQRSSTRTSNTTNIHTQ